MEGREKSMGEEEVLHSPSTLMQELGLLCCMLIAVFADLSWIYSGFMVRLEKLGFAILYSGTTINDRGKSERSMVKRYLYWYKT